MGSIGGSRILLLSSGIDSLCAFYTLNKPSCLHITSHSRYSAKELHSIYEFQERHLELSLEIVEMRCLRKFEEDDASIISRNSFFAHIGALYADIVYLVCQRGEQTIPDRSLRFFEDISALLSYLHGRPKLVDAVFTQDTKQDMVKKYLELGYPKEELLTTYSCESAEPGRCGQCKMCARTAIALDYCSILPEDFFVRDIWKWPDWQDYIRKMRNGLYEKRRTEQTLGVLSKRGLV